MRRWFVLCLAACAAHAQNTFTLSDLNASPTLTAMAGGDFTAETTMVGDGAIQAAGGDFTLDATVTSLPVTIEPGAVEVFLALEGENFVLTWPESGAGYLLESAVALSDATVWQPVQPAPTERRFVTPLAQPAVFFRLRRP